MPKKPTAVPPPPLQDDEEDQEILGDREPGFVDGEDDPLTRRWFREQLGGTGVDDPREAGKPTRLREQLQSAPIHAAADIEGAESWLVEKRNDTSGEADWLGYAHLSIGYPAFIKKFLPSMPKMGEDPAQFYFTPIDKAGSKLGAPGKPKVTNIPWDNAVLRDIRASMPQGGDGLGSDPVIQLLREQSQRDREERIAAAARVEKAEERARQAEEKALTERLAQAGSVTTDLSGAFQRVQEVQREGFTSMMSAADKMAMERERREEDRARRERESEDNRRAQEKVDRDAERTRQREEAAAALERVKADNAAALERVKAEAEARLKEIEVKARLEEAKINADVEKAKALAAAEVERIKADRDREDQRRKDEQAREDKRREDEEKRRQDYALQMEKIRTDSRADDRLRQDAEARRQDEHVKAVLAIYERGMTGKGAGDNKLGVLGEVLDGLGMTPSDAVEKAKDFFSSGEGIGVTIAKGIFELGQTLVKRIPMDDGEEEEEEEEEDGSEEEEEPEEERHRRRRRQVAAPKTGPQLTDFLAHKTPDPVPVEVENATLQPPAIPLAEARAGRGAVASMVERLTGVEEAQWPEVIMAGTDLDAMVRYVARVGLVKALEGSDLDAEKVGAALVALGLFAVPPLTPQEPK